MHLNWHEIRPLNGSQANGFEELCAQLARAEISDAAKFERKGTPDAGVECYCVFPDGSEWGWQAKYFHTFEPPQWSQLDQSVKKSLDKHPALTRYFVCIPLDRPDARVSRRKSMKHRWDERVEKWRAWAQERSLSVEFVWWGSSELLERLSRTEHIGRTYFWFNRRGFDAPWFRARLDEAVQAAGPRYTPEIHIDLPIARDLESFGRSPAVFDDLKSRAKGIRRAFQTVSRLGRHEEEPSRAVSTETLTSSLDEILDAMAQIKPVPIGKLPFAGIAEKITTALEKTGKILEAPSRLEDECLAEHLKKETPSSPKWSSFGERRNIVYRLQSELDDARSSLERADSIAGGQLMLLKGKAGTGKTHLLCDFAKRRLEAGVPTVLLMGQRFIATDDPWTQAIQQLGLQDVSAEEFVGALEMAAQAAGRRALLIIDALNEGQGRSIWPAHLAAFLASVQKSPWIGVLLSVRSEYEDAIIPEEIRNQAAFVIHHGFEGQEYEAAKTFFSHYGLEFPSSPILYPEFNHPLFLKTVCLGLKGTGQRRLPRGFHGITAVFDLFLQAVNGRLAKSLDFDPREQLVRAALEKLADRLGGTGARWMERGEAKAVVDALLPNRGFEDSLYRGLVVEGVLSEGMRLQQEEPGSEFVYVSYNRFADHLVADSLLRKHLDSSAPQAAFEEGGPLAFIWNGDAHLFVPPGLIEALCIQIPERTGRELFDLAPALYEHWGAGNAFRQSVVWRKPEAFSDTTGQMLNRFIRHDRDMDGALNVLLTVATLEHHSLNAEFLDKRLRRDSMPERDAWWSTYLHRAWETQGAVDRLIDWAWAVKPDDKLDGATVDLCSIALAWMLTTSNRFVRDRATKAMVSLLTGRVEATVKLVGRFADVDDPYVIERVYAVAYGVAMRSHDAAGVGRLASLVYEKVFADGHPPAHILLRDYARGVVERALYLGSDLEIDERSIRPPYKSTWPKIPTEEEIQPLIPDLSQELSDREKIGGRLRIQFSVMNDGDFARYVIGTNWHQTNWLSLSLDEKPWQQMKGSPRVDFPPWFDLTLVQRYVFWRVFDLGWTDDLFGEFDGSRGDSSRRGNKPERVGKKYQWIAYHEILAYIADHYQYQPRYGEDSDERKYEGPWQDTLRDIDPSCTLRSPLEDLPEDADHKPSWWAPSRYENWKDDLTHRDWVMVEDVPDIEALLCTTNPADESRWINASGYFGWTSPHPADVEPSLVDRRIVWLACTAYVLRVKDSEAFINWAKAKDFWDGSILEPPRFGDMFLGEYPWSPAFHSLNRSSADTYGRKNFEGNCPVQVRAMTYGYRKELGRSDCSVDGSYFLRLPDLDFVERLGLRWFGSGTDYLDEDGRLAAFDPTTREEGARVLLIREDILKRYLSKNGLVFCWIISGERVVYRSQRPERGHRDGILNIRGVGILEENEPRIYLRYIPELQDENPD